MPFEKGKSGNPAGRPKGSKNRSTTALREALALLVEENAENMTTWLERIAEDDPKAAFQCLVSIMEFHLPKHSRIAWTEPLDEKARLTGKDTDDIAKSVAAALEKVKNK